ncbi:hypothetical protein AMS62_27795 [Bacillus sp. FJAT-18019]|nr:hypothetical protein AMS62_27795 [Bacillus sp. FJAT-18019]
MVEAFTMEITFEVFREAGVRMPRVIGLAISIVGALVLGQAAVQAGLVSAAMVIIVALRPLPATLGLFGIMAGMMATLIHLSGLRTFGIPYLVPFAIYIPNLPVSLTGCRCDSH